MSELLKACDLYRKTVARAGKTENLPALWSSAAAAA